MITEAGYLVMNEPTFTAVDTRTLQHATTLSNIPCYLVNIVPARTEGS